LSFPGAVTAKPPSGGLACWRSFSSDLRSTGKRESADREATASASIPASWSFQPGAVFARAIKSGSAANCARSRASGARVSSSS